ncbi:MAG: DUF1566 domain-containing protein [Bacteroidia bacterium]|nr:DUF1566 domain-containing protein [Bacteroidia bacterium]
MKTVFITTTIIGFFLFSIISCKKSETNDTIIKIPILTTITVSDSTDSISKCGGIIMNNDIPVITSKGVCWSTQQSPTINDNKTNNGIGSVNFTSIMTGLSFGTTYYVRAYATNSEGTGYGEIIKFSKGIGKEFQGGKIAYFFQPGDPGYIAGQNHGLIVATENIYIPIQGNPGLFLFTWHGLAYLDIITSYELGTGLTNTNTIVSTLGLSGNYAAKVCYSLVLNGYSDWYLPSRDELYILYKNKNTINSDLRFDCWSSTQKDSIYAWKINFETGKFASWSAHTELCVRAIRNF